MKLKIISDGTALNTKVLNADTGEEIEDILNVEVSIDPFNVSAAFLVANPGLSITGLEAQEVHVGDRSLEYDRGTSNTDD